MVTVRPFNTYGPRQSARAVIPAIITQALTSDVVNVGNLETTRDFTFVSDTVNGFLKAAETQGVDGKTFNLGTGADVKIGELARKILSIIGSTAEVRVDANRLRPKDSEVYQLLSHNGLARQALGWQPQTELDCGLEQTIAWIKNHLELYRIGSYEF